MEDSDLLTGDDILGADDLKLERQEIPEWPKNGKPGIVYLKTMSGIERDEWDKFVIRYHTEADRNGNFRLKPTLQRDLLRPTLLSKIMVGPDGTPLFKTSSQVVALGGKSAAVLERLYDRALTLNGLNKKELEEMAKNSEGTSTDDLPSA